jgi:hypothetical protein
MKLGFSRQIFGKRNSNFRFHDNSSSGDRGVPCERKEERRDMMKLPVAFRSFKISLNKHKYVFRFFLFFFFNFIFFERSHPVVLCQYTSILVYKHNNFYHKMAIISDLCVDMLSAHFIYLNFDFILA